MFQVQHVPILKPEICSLDGLGIFLYITQFYLSNNMLVCPFQRIPDPSPHVYLLMRIIETKNVTYMPHVRIQIWITRKLSSRMCTARLVTVVVAEILGGGGCHPRGGNLGGELLSITGSDIMTPPVNRVTDRQV